MTLIFNLATGEERYYTMKAEDAVRAAWLQSRGDYNTWSYDQQAVPLVRGKHTIGAGDWCALLKKNK